MDRHQGKAVCEPLFVKLMRGIVPDALRLTTYWIGNSTAAEDIVQEAIAKAWIHHHRLPTIANPRAWFFTILRRECINYFRHRDRRLVAVDIDPSPPVSPPDAYDPYEAADLRIDIAALLRRLSPRDREMLAWRYGMDWSLEDIAESTGIPLSTVKSRIYRALKILRGRMNDAARSEP
ncbi:MAG: sigma-70 family RNA polymerase sigma factor [Thermaerobacter sp.]|nr:sigma-70 family RNA polymerase sigma factor [Thermaerobacter sp.]